MSSLVRKFALTLAMLVSIASLAAGQVVQGSGVGSNLRVTVLDQTDAALVNAPSVKRVEIDGADHMYSGKHVAVADTIAAWLGQFRRGA